MADEPGDLGQVWTQVIADLSGASSPAGSLSGQQRAFLRLTRPLGLIDGTALLAAPTDFAKDAIERILRRPISDALGRHLGTTITLAVVVDASAASGGTEVPDPPVPAADDRPVPAVDARPAALDPAAVPPHCDSDTAR
ncbi:MAG: chromosomal replication initiation protein DnaA, partial [Pseudonocardia sp.]|nr:chromosomal replication initiation protein DnaA [Pseudonocardia sp.]